MKLIISLFFSLILSSTLFAQDSTFRISTTHLTGNFYVYTSYGKYANTIFPANGLYVVTDSGIVIIDTPWSEAQTQQLIDTLTQQYHQKIVLAIATHFHDDRTIGLDVFKKNGIKTYTSKLTADLCKAGGYKQPEFTFDKDTTFTVGKLRIQTYYPGEGHTKDNLLIWFPKDQILYGGCFIKSLEAKTIGFTGDSNLAQWPASLHNVATRFKHTRYIIPGHQGWQGNAEMITHTLELLK
ncbi:metallo-beta-lactamase class B [Chitinophaga niastensis]|uniref:beta-lactamase n=1 Tax=Chitinophaga niastensis TaxID=536980 RepID=A0A2P8HQ58_CHINA|nr:BlaB/IND/MUS family subclass B1 metallo-beta-lactamase [Chitinophaga niastensis]PSL48373.1 metallo-beta-lactamase class B [Chitinophaga niastensis]